MRKRIRRELSAGVLFMAIAALIVKIMKYQSKSEVEASFDEKIHGFYGDGETPVVLEKNEFFYSVEGIKSFFSEISTSRLDSLIEHCEGMKRTDETQMHEDHIHDEALSDMISHLKELKETI